MNLRLSKEEDARAIAELHYHYIPQGTLNILGVGFLTMVYRTLARSRNCFCFVAEEERKIAGFIAGTTSMSKFYQEFLAHNFFQIIGFFSVKIFYPNVFKKVLRLARYPKVSAQLPDAEIMSLVVVPDFRKKGLIFVLLKKMVLAFQEKKIPQARSSIGSSAGHVPLYEMLGVELFQEMDWSSGEKLKIFTWDIEKMAPKLNALSNLQ